MSERRRPVVIDMSNWVETIETPIPIGRRVRVVKLAACSRSNPWLVRVELNNPRVGVGINLRRAEVATIVRALIRAARLGEQDLAEPAESVRADDATRERSAP